MPEPETERQTLDFGKRSKNAPGHGLCLRCSDAFSNHSGPDSRTSASFGGICILCVETARVHGLWHGLLADILLGAGRPVRSSLRWITSEAAEPVVLCNRFGSACLPSPVR